MAVAIVGFAVAFLVTFTAGMLGEPYGWAVVEGVCVAGLFAISVNLLFAPRWVVVETVDHESAVPKC